MCRLFRSIQLVFTAALALLVLTGCQVESGGGFTDSTPATSNQTQSVVSNSEAVESDDGVAESAPATSSQTQEVVSNSETVTSPEAQRSVSLYWSAPAHRINGEDIAIDDLGGYEIRYRKQDEAAYTRVVIEDPLIEQYHIDTLTEDDYVFEVAAFDKDGLYSDFVTAVR